jgi:biopolymer transport protein ExbD
MKFTTRKKRQPPAVIIVALIDVLIVVLIFLMVTTSFKHRQPSVKLTLPASEQALPGATDKNPLIITISKTAPHFHLSDRANDLPVTLDRLKAELAERAKRNPELHVAVRPDKDAIVDNFVKVMDALRAANVRNIEMHSQSAGGTGQ